MSIDRKDLYTYIYTAYTTYMGHGQNMKCGVWSSIPERAADQSPRSKIGTADPIFSIIPWLIQREGTNFDGYKNAILGSNKLLKIHPGLTLVAQEDII